MENVRRSILRPGKPKSKRGAARPRQRACDHTTGSQRADWQAEMLCPYLRHCRLVQGTHAAPRARNRPSARVGHIDRGLQLVMRK